MQPIKSALQAIPLPATGWSPPTPETQHVKLKGQAEEFAGLLYAQLFKAMREASDSSEGGLFGGDSDMFSTFFDQKIGKTFAEQGGNALEAALDRQLTSKLDAQEKIQGGHH
jgi:Rod binding domain-containing protein